MSFAYVSSPGVPTIRPRNLSGVGTVVDAGRWSTSSVVIRGSCRYSLIFRVYSSSFGCAVARAGLLCARAVAAMGPIHTAAAAMGHMSRRTDRIRRDISFLLLWVDGRMVRPGNSQLTYALTHQDARRAFSPQATAG